MIDPTPYGGRAGLARRAQSDHRPRRLIGRAGEGTIRIPLEVVAVVALAPTAIRVLPREKPRHGAPHGRVMRRDARELQCHEHRPGAVEVVGAPAAEPGA